MSAEQDEKLAEAMVERFARAKNIPLDEAKAKYLPLLRSPDIKQRIKQDFSDAAAVIGEAEAATKDANPMLQEYVAQLAGKTVTQITSGKESEDLDTALSRTAREVGKIKGQMKIIDSAFKEETQPQSAPAASNPEIETLKGTVGTVLKQVESLTETLTSKKKTEERQEMLDEIDKRIKPLETLGESLKAYQEKLEGGESDAGKIDKMVSNLAKYEDDVKTFLTGRGYNVSAIKGMTEDEVRKILDEERAKIMERLTPDEVKHILERKGYKIEGGPMSYDDFLSRMNEERKKFQEDKTAEQQIKAVENITTSAVDRLITEMVAPLVRIWYEVSTKPDAPAEQPSQSSSQEEARPSG